MFKTKGKCSPVTQILETNELYEKNYYREIKRDSRKVRNGPNIIETNVKLGEIVYR